MSSPAGGAPNLRFLSRLNRVADARAPFEEGKKPVNVLPDWKRDVAARSGLPVALLVGMLAVLLVRIGEYHYIGMAMITETPNFTIVMETACATMLSFLLFLFLPFKGIRYRLAQVAGVVVAISMMHNAVHAAPSLFSLVFSPDWTARVTAATEPNTVYFRGEVIPLEFASQEEKVLPRVLRLE